MPADVYQQLARRLDETPNGFPATESGVELRLLAKVFTPEEAHLASVMTLHAEPSCDIASRAGIDSKEAYKTLKGMASKGLVSFKKGKGKLLFALEPFIVGFYEAQLPRIDKEMASLFEQYFHESGGAVSSIEPSVHRVIPIQEAIPHEITIFPHEQASQIVEAAKAWGVRNCICRVQKRLIGEGCHAPLEVCLTLAPFEGAFDHSQVDRAITKEEALEILHKAEEAGLVHSTGNYISRIYYICNCCTCCCGVLRAIKEFGIPTAMARADFYAVVNDALCMGCGDCLGYCPFNAISLSGGMAAIDRSRCMGCGLCSSGCALDALHLERRPAEESHPIPQNIKEWGKERIKHRGEIY
ncbi:MAG: 4Fe-4S binding protein [Anaerolineales bacterium]|nr:4Fe-4S binding protein [Anaerolineales bacterium]